MTQDGRFSAMGQDRRAEAAVIEVVYGSVPEFLVASGFGPGGRNAMRERDEWSSHPGLWICILCMH
jgi:hypothetical protein